MNTALLLYKEKPREPWTDEVWEGFTPCKNKVTMEKLILENSQQELMSSTASMLQNFEYLFYTFLSITGMCSHLADETFKPLKDILLYLCLLWQQNSVGLLV